MKNKGFTLFEGLAVIIILGIVGSLVIVNVNKSLKNSENELYKKQVNEIKRMAEGWGAKHLLPDDGSALYISLDTLIKETELDSKNIIDPRNKEPMKGCVRIIYKDNNFEISYISNKDNEYYECNNAM